MQHWFGLVTRLGRLGSAQFVGAELDLAQPKSKKAEARLGLGQPNLIWATGVFGKAHPYANPLYFIPLLKIFMVFSCIFLSIFLLILVCVFIL
jgi:hypothetical protein